MSKIKSPLRYPGGKYRAISEILPLVGSSVSEMVSPFFGGGSIELACANRGIRVHGYDKFDDLVCFWQVVLTNPEQLAEAVQNYYPLSKEKFYDLQRSKPLDQFNKAIRFYVLNRSSFSGSTLSGGMSPGHPRFTQSSIDRIKSFAVQGVTVEEKSFEDSLNAHPTLFAYLDPPYFIKSMLYGVKGSMHKGFDHKGLRDILSGRNSWIMSYNECPEIRALYAGHRITTPSWTYGMSASKESKEILIFSRDF